MEQDVLASLDIMWKGMAGIFVVMILLMVCVMILTKVTSDKKEEPPKE